MNTYWPVYKKIEESTLKVAEMIQFNDEQLKVYSSFIGDLIVRCAIEIESISKDLYAKLGGNPKVLDTNTGHDRNPYFDTDCIALLVSKWKVDKKKIQIVNPNMHFGKDFSVLTPLHKSHRRGTSGSNWKKAYQAIKHNRSKEIKSANIENLLNALGALYILNLYYKDDSYWKDKPIKGRKPFQNNSDIFHPFIHDALSIELLGDYFGAKESTEKQECLYVKKFTNESFFVLCSILFEADYKSKHEIYLSKNNIDYIQNHRGNGNEQFADVVARTGLNVNEIITKNIKLGYSHHRLDPEIEIVLNHEEEIYPKHTYDEFLKTDRARQIEQNAVNAFNSSVAKHSE